MIANDSLIPVLVDASAGVILSLLVLSLTACAKRNMPAPASTLATNTRSFLDLKAGWRLRVVLPVTRSGGAVHLETKETSGNTVTVSADKDLVGYETQYFAIGGGKRVRLRFTGGSLTIGGVETAEKTPHTSVLRPPTYSAFVRLLFLERASSADHDMAMLASRRGALLDKATEQVRSDPELCEQTDELVCMWIPKGVAVIAERRGDRVQGWTAAE